MANIATFNEDVNIISGLTDYPNQEDGLSADELKAKFDKASTMLKAYLNEVVVPAINGIIDDEETEEMSTWSSQKVSAELIKLVNNLGELSDLLTEARENIKYLDSENDDLDSEITKLWNEADSILEAIPIIDDDAASKDRIWSSQKIYTSLNELLQRISELNQRIVDAAEKIQYLEEENEDRISNILQLTQALNNIRQTIPLINDNAVSKNSVWSSTLTSARFNAIMDQLASLLTRMSALEAAEKTVIDDTTISADSTWSSQKTLNEIEARISNQPDGSTVTASTVANALTATKEGNIIKLDDISPLQKELTLELTTDQFMHDGGSVLVCGKNLLNFRDLGNSRTTVGGLINPNGIRLERDASASPATAYAPVYIPANVPFVISYKILEFPKDHPRPWYAVRYADNTRSTPTTYRGEVLCHDKAISQIQFGIHAKAEEGSYFKISDIQLEIGEVSTEYVAYTEPRELPAVELGYLGADQTFEVTPELGATIFIRDSSFLGRVKYNRDIAKAFAELQNAIISLGGTV